MAAWRVTYELMAGYWPTATPEADDPRIIEAMNKLAKVVFSRTLKTVCWNNSRLVKGDVAREEHGDLRQRFHRVRACSGGMIDEYRLLVAPVVQGRGRPLFRDIANRLALRLSETRSFATGLVLLRYQP
jgi:dihydrofolate reductase